MTWQNPRKFQEWVNGYKHFGDQACCCPRKAKGYSGTESGSECKRKWIFYFGSKETGFSSHLFITIVYIHHKI